MIGIPHPDLGRAGARHRRAPSRCRGDRGGIRRTTPGLSIAGYKVPKSVEFRTEPIPLSGALKPLKRELRRPYWEHVEPDSGTPAVSGATVAQHEDR